MPKKYRQNCKWKANVKTGKKKEKRQQNVKSRPTKICVTWKYMYQRINETETTDKTGKTRKVETDKTLNENRKVKKLSMKVSNK